jgi:hypothetical protein
MHFNMFFCSLEININDFIKDVYKFFKCLGNVITAPIQYVLKGTFTGKVPWFFILESLLYNSYLSQIMLTGQPWERQQVYGLLHYEGKGKVVIVLK